MRAAWITAALLTGCMTGEIPHEDPNQVVAKRACADLEGSIFRSVTPGECGLGPDGVAQCYWALTFSAYDETMSRYSWSHSDVGELGYVTCEGDSIRSLEATAYEGHVDANLDLMWDGVAYVLVP